MEKKADNELKEVTLKAADYTNNGTERYIRRIHVTLLAGAMLWFISGFIRHTSLVENHVLSAISEFCEGAACGLIILGLLIITTRYGQKLQAFKLRLLKRH